MTCEAEERALAEIRLRRLDAAYHAQLEAAKAELDVLRSSARIYDWGAVRLAEALTRCWDSRCAQAENALERCKQQARRDD